MSDSKDFLNDFVFEQYLYDYLVKKGLPEIAETFRQEINLPFDISTPPLIDVPDSFLLEWWLTYYEMFKAYEARSLQVKENSSNKVQGITNVNQESDPYLQNAQIFSEPMRREVTGGVTTGGSLVPMMGSPSVASQPSQNLSAILERFYQPVNLSNVFIQGVGPSSLATPNIRKDALNKNRRKRKNSSSSNDGSTPGATASSVETSASVFQPSKESDSKEVE